jgi:hypothetical protein
MAVNLSPYGGVGAQFFDNSGNVLTGGKIETYAAGTTTPQATYTTSAGIVFHSNPIILDASGRVPSGGEIWLTDGLSYKFVLKDSNNVLIATYDNIIGINSNFVNFTNEQEIQTATAGQTVFNLTTTNYQPGTNSLSVFVDGVNQYGPGAQYAYLETDSDTVTFINGLHVGALVKFTTSQLNSSGATDASQVSYNEGDVGAVTYTVEQRLQQFVTVKDFGAIGNGIADDTAAIQAAIDAVDIGGTVYLFGGVFKTTQEILITKTISIVGEDARIGNVVDPLSSKSCIITESATDAAGILVNNCVATFKNFVIVNGPTTPSVRVDGIRCTGGNGSLKIYDLLVEGFLTGIRSTTNYYNTIENTSIYACDECLRFDNCFNVNLVGLKLQTNNVPVFSAATHGIVLSNGSQVNMFGGAIENFGTSAVYLPDASGNVCLFGVYFESSSTASTSYVVRANSFSNIIAIGCNVYMTQSERFITVEDGGSVGVRVYSRNNKIVYPTTTKTVDVYVPLAGDTTASWDIANDNWQSPIGANVTYLTYEGVGGDGNLQIQYPIGHPDFLKPVNSVPYVQNAWTAPPTLPISSQTASVLPTLVSFANVNGTTDDPLGLHLTTWGYKPYMTAYQNGQWEKVGTRLPNQVNSTATTVADLVTDFNALLTKLRNNGVMV